MHTAQASEKLAHTTTAPAGYWPPPERYRDGPVGRYIICTHVYSQRPHLLPSRPPPKRLAHVPKTAAPPMRLAHAAKTAGPPTWLAHAAKTTATPLSAL